MKVFIVDDYYDYAETIKIMFEYKGHTAIYCINSKTAVDIAKNFRPDWVVLDIRMPYKSGVTVYRELKKEASFPFSAVFYTNYYSEPEIMNEFENLVIPNSAVIPKTTEMSSDIENRIIPALQAGYLSGGRTQ